MGLVQFGGGGRGSMSTLKKKINLSAKCAGPEGKINKHLQDKIIEFKSGI